MLGKYILIYGVTLGPQEFLDTNMLVLATRRSCIEGYSPTQSLNKSGFALQWIIGFRVTHNYNCFLFLESAHRIVYLR